MTEALPRPRPRTCGVVLSGDLRAHPAVRAWSAATSLAAEPEWVHVLPRTGEVLQELADLEWESVRLNSEHAAWRNTGVAGVRSVLRRLTDAARAARVLEQSHGRRWSS